MISRYARTVCFGALFSISGVAATRAFAALPPLTPLAAASGTQITTSYGIEFSTIGSVNNPVFRVADHPDVPFANWSDYDGRGSVDHAYRMSRTEITVGQWLEFVQAFAPHWEGAPDDDRMTGWYIGPVQTGGYHADSWRVNQAALGMSWLVSAAYCNWMTNGRQNTEAAFRTGAYELQGINLATRQPMTTPISGNANAAYRLPTLDEWNKAVYFDPNRYGQGMPGWWIYPGGSDQPLVPGLPASGGQTDCGVSGGANQVFEVAAYVGVQTPWGIFDASGGESEWIVDGVSGWPMRNTSGSVRAGGVPTYFYDAIGVGGGYSFEAQIGSVIAGVRLVATVPAPGTAVMLAAGAWYPSKRKRWRN
ncbi:hypothetical protein BH11PLA1_BH11PLA1_07200 [soil metagenome]